LTELFDGPDHATPLEPAEREGLIPSWVSHRSELNEVEQDNILKGAAWAKGKRGLDCETILSVAFAKELHKRMFGAVWEWAGHFRSAERNIGIAASLIRQELPGVFADAKYWIEHGTYKKDEIAIRLHHRLVAIHPFPNGNGRHTRMMADLLIEKLGGHPFSWGRESLMDVGPLRTRYIAALQAADGHDIRPLIDFARS
jgi:Fic-DOC domain mobile mystery protein B